MNGTTVGEMIYSGKQLFSNSKLHIKTFYSEILHEFEGIVPSEILRINLMRALMCRLDEVNHNSFGQEN